MDRTFFAALVVISGLNAASAMTFTVTNTNDSGAGSFRQALIDANANPGGDTINFNISGATQKTITVLSDLPHISETVVIDGGNNGVATNRVQISGPGSGMGIASGLEVNNAAGTEIRNLIINGFNRQIGLFPGINTKIQGCRLVTNPAGTAMVGGGEAIETCCGTSGVLIGGTTPAERNIISADASNTAVVINTGSATIRGNFIGVDPSGTAVVGPPRVGVSVGNSFGVIGGTNAGEGNVIVASINGVEFSGNPALGQSSGTVQSNLIGTDAAGTAVLAPGNASGTGISVTHATGVLINGGNVIAGFHDGIGINQNSINGNHSDHITIQQNFIGVAADGVTNLGNNGSGIENNCPDNVVGGINAGEGNVIAFNSLAGVHHRSAVNNRTEGNKIFSNGGLGIDLETDGPTLNDVGDSDTGANNLQNFPELTAVTNTGMTSVDGRLNSAANTMYRLEFFACDKAAIDATGYGEGKRFLGFKDVPTDGSGNATFNAILGLLNPGERVTATATDPNGNTSEFSGAIGQLINLSTRMEVLTGGSVLIGGFIISGGTKDVLLRALGPTLTQFGVNGVLGDPTIELHDSTGALITSNDNWKSDQQAAIAATGKAPPNDLEPAIRRPLNAGNYTAIVRGKNQTTGIGLVEVYDLDEAINTTLTNISTRGFVDTDQNVMIGGFIPGDGIVRVIIRALGPTLTQFGVPTVLADPILELHDGQGTLITSNDNWKDTQQAEIQASGKAPPNDNESAIIAVRPAGNSTAIVRGKGNTTGNALVEVYILPP